jgi:hypothetical protein
LLGTRSPGLALAADDHADIATTLNKSDAPSKEKGCREYIPDKDCLRQSIKGVLAIVFTVKEGKLKLSNDTLIAWYDACRSKFLAEIPCPIGLLSSLTCSDRMEGICCFMQTT